MSKNFLDYENGLEDTMLQRVFRMHAPTSAACAPPITLDLAHRATQAFVRASYGGALSISLLRREVEEQEYVDVKRYGDWIVSGAYRVNLVKEVGPVGFSLLGGHGSDATARMAGAFMAGYAFAMNKRSML